MERRYTLAHWGAFEADDSVDRGLHPLTGDSDPLTIGADQLCEHVERLRVRAPAVRRSWLVGGPGAKGDQRGREEFVEMDWPTALDLVAREIERIRARYSNDAIFGGSYGWSSAGRFHHAQSQVHRFLNSIGGYVRHVDTYSLGAGRVIMPYVMGEIDDLIAEHSSWSVLAEHTRLFVAFGGVPLKNSRVSPGGATDHNVRRSLNEMAAAGVRFVNVSPLRDNLEAGDCVEWVQIRPNTDAALMLALIFVLIDDNMIDQEFIARCCSGFDIVEAYVCGRSDGVAKEPRWAAAITGVSEERIRTLAHEMAATRTLINVAWALQRAEHGEQPFWAAVTLASALGQIGLPGGGIGFGYGAMNAIGSDYPRFRGPTLPQGRNRIEAFIPVARIADMLLHPKGEFRYRGQVRAYPEIRLIYWAGGNPFHHHQDLNRLRDAWARPETIIVHEQYWTAAARFADIVLPATIAMERNDIGFATRERYMIAMKKLVEPSGAARDDFAIFAALAERLGAGKVFTDGLDERGWLARMYGESRESARLQGIVLPPFDRFWSEGIIDLAPYRRSVTFLDSFRRDPVASPLTTESGRIQLFSPTIAHFDLPDCWGHAAWLPPKEWIGAAPKPDALHLISDQPANRLHGQLDHGKASVEGKIDGREPILMNPFDAARRGIEDGMVVEVSNGRGRSLAAARLSETVMPGVARLPTGAWYDPDPIKATEQHGNPNVLTCDSGASELSQGCSAGSCLIWVQPFVGKPPTVGVRNPPRFATRGQYLGDHPVTEAEDRAGNDLKGRGDTVRPF